MLDPTLVAFELAAVAELESALGDLVQEVTRRKLGYAASNNPWYEVDIAILPSEGEGHPLSGNDIGLTATLRCFGRGTNGVLDRVRFVLDLAYDTLLTGEKLRELWAQADKQVWEREVSVDAGATVVIEQVSVSTRLQNVISVGPAIGIVERMAGVAPGVRARVTLTKPVIYSTGGVVIAPATVTGLYAGLVGVETIELVNQSGAVVAQQEAGESAGTVSFAEIGEGFYELRIVTDNRVAARSPLIRVISPPN